MTLQQEHRKIVTDFKQASGLLRHDLVWSEDFEAIREDLALYLDEVSHLGAANNPSLVRVVRKLISAENDLTV